MLTYYLIVPFVLMKTRPLFWPCQEALLRETLLCSYLAEINLIVPDTLLTFVSFRTKVRQIGFVYAYFQTRLIISAAAVQIFKFKCLISVYLKLFFFISNQLT